MGDLAGTGTTSIGEDIGRGLSWRVDASRIGELLQDMHDSGCSITGQGESSCRACLCVWALYRLKKKVNRLVAGVLPLLVLGE